MQIRSLNGRGFSAQEISDCLRKMDTPVIGHIVDDWVYLEMRTIRTGEELEILRKELKYDLYKEKPSMTFRKSLRVLAYYDFISPYAMPVLHLQSGLFL